MLHHVPIACTTCSCTVDFCVIVRRATLGALVSDRCGERVGICGRSGSGKSSLALALVRMVECFQGSITVDGLDIKEVPLSLLRSAVTVISQDAHLFSGTVREVIDPLGQVCLDEPMQLQDRVLCYSCLVATL